MSSSYEERMKTKHFRPFHIGHLTEDLVVKAKEELNETDQAREECLLALRELVLEETDLKCLTTDDYLIQYLRARKFNLQKSFSLLKASFHVKKSYVELYSKIDIPLLEAVFKAGIVSMLPYRADDHSSVIIVKVGRWDPDQFSFAPIARALTAALMFAISDPATQVTGLRAVIDIQGGNLKHLKHMAPRYMHLISRALRNCLPIRFKGIHILNENVLFQYFWGLLKIFLSEKIRNRFHFHGDNQKQLQKFIAKEILPEEYGGDNTDHSGSTWFPQQIEKFYDYYSELHNCGYNS